MKKNLGSAERRHWSSKIWIDHTRAWTLGKGHHKHNKFGSECKLVVQDPLEIDPSGGPRKLPWTIPISKYFLKNNNKNKKQVKSGRCTLNYNTTYTAKET